MGKEPILTVGIMDRETRLAGQLNGDFRIDEFRLLSGPFSAKVTEGKIALADGVHREIIRSPSIRLAPLGRSTFSLFQVTVGTRFPWEKKEDLTFRGDFILRLREDGTILALNEVSLEDYLTSVISSEMRPTSPIEFLKAHAILSRSWLLASLHRKSKTEPRSVPRGKISEKEGEVIRWYDRTDHDLFDVCADDHCQRYQGMTKIVSEQAKEAVEDTRGLVITYQGEICDARYSKCCGGLTEEFDTAWDDRSIPYLRSISDTPIPHPPIRTEEEASQWILSAPEAYCHTKERGFLEEILPELDLQTKDFFRWRIECPRGELEEILRERSGFDFGALREIVPLHRGPSGRVSRLRIVGSKKSVLVGKELEIRRWLSRTHLPSSAFVVTFEGKRIILDGAGWGHGVGLCQIGAAVMGARGSSAEKILGHYFRDVKIEKLY
jgi:stage II sporulation protein D